MLSSADRGPLSGLVVIELGGIGPLPFACMVLGDLGATVVRVDRPTNVGRTAADAIEASLIGSDHLGRGRRRVSINLKHPDGVALFLRLAEGADVVMEGFRPGVVERLGIGPDSVLARNPRIVYGRVSGWGRSGPLASAPGHDINYIALAGVGDTLRPRTGGVPINPVGHIGDFGGGGMLLVVGVLAALNERERSGLGQVVDSSSLDGALLLNTLSRYLSLNDPASGPPGTNALDGGSHFFGAYRTKDGKHVVFGALEPSFHDAMLIGLGIDPNTVDQYDRSAWPRLRQQVEEIVASRTRAEWQEIFEGSDACFAPVLETDEVHLHPHHVSRGSFVEIDEQLQAAPAPRFSRSHVQIPSGVRSPGSDTTEVLRCLGVPDESIKSLLQEGVVAEPPPAPAGFTELIGDG